MSPEIPPLELLTTTNDLLMRCLELLDQSPTFTESEQKEAMRLQMICAQVLDANIQKKGYN